MQRKITEGDVVSINDKVAVVVEVLDKSQTKKERCYIKQEGKRYCVLISDLKLEG